MMATYTSSIRFTDKAEQNPGRLDEEKLRTKLVSLFHGPPKSQSSRTPACCFEKELNIFATEDARFLFCGSFSYRKRPSSCCMLCSFRQLSQRELQKLPPSQRVTYRKRYQAILRANAEKRRKRSSSIALRTMVLNKPPSSTVERQQPLVIVLVQFNRCWFSNRRRLPWC